MFIVQGADGKEYGPVASAQVRAWMLDGRADLHTRVRHRDSGTWKTLADFPEFNGGIVTGATEKVPSAPPLLTADSSAAEPAGEVVVPVANRWLRLTAALVDGLLKNLCMFPISSAVMAVADAQQRAGEQVPNLDAMVDAIKFGFVHALPYLGALTLIQGFLLSSRGQSIGKSLVGLRIVRAATGETAGFLQAFLLRGCITTCLELVPLFGFLFLLVDGGFIFSEDGRCLHDHIAGTRVVEVRKKRAESLNG